MPDVIFKPPPADPCHYDMCLVLYYSVLFSHFIVGFFLRVLHLWCSLLHFYSRIFIFYFYCPLLWRFLLFLYLFSISVRFLFFFVLSEIFATTKLPTGKSTIRCDLSNASFCESITSCVRSLFAGNTTSAMYSSRFTKSS
ncbi:hypothetical protein BCR42DRAFT_159414 [Absidia repens]|uniref:Uncharacterized protein n=1 Tax=Absidia repens TaxID=90262 RepID=A0A1X2HZX3_9FUNG|nr:hypothetical protein BCR42DRAFT_159414 [Absidia repens]